MSSGAEVDDEPKERAPRDGVADDLEHDFEEHTASELLALLLGGGELHHCERDRVQHQQVDGGGKEKHALELGMRRGVEGGKDGHTKREVVLLRDEDATDACLAPAVG